MFFDVGMQRLSKKLESESSCTESQTWKRVSIFAPNLNLKDVPVKEFLENNLKVENDARAISLGEQWFGEMEQE